MHQHYPNKVKFGATIESMLFGLVKTGLNNREADDRKCKYW